MARILVTGGAGFIGGHLVRSLIDRGDEVVVLDDLSTGRRDVVPAEATLIEADVTDRQAVYEAVANTSACIHLAAIASVARCNEQLTASHAVNITGLLNVLEALNVAGRGDYPLVYASSAAVYGASQNLPLRESDPAAPLSPYGADKYACELHARAAEAVYGRASVGMRFFNVFGPGQDPSSPYSGVISLFADRLRKGEGLRIFGDGLQTRDFVYVGDVVLALMAALDARPSGARVFNVCTGRETTVLELAHIMAAAMGVEPTIEHLEARKGDIRLSQGDPGQLADGLGVVATVDLGSGLRQLADSLG